MDCLRGQLTEPLQRAELLLESRAMAQRIQVRTKIRARLPSEPVVDSAPPLRLCAAGRPSPASF